MSLRSLSRPTFSRVRASATLGVDYKQASRKQAAGRVEYAKWSGSAAGLMRVKQQPCAKRTSNQLRKAVRRETRQTWITLTEQEPGEKPRHYVGFAAFCFAVAVWSIGSHRRSHFCARAWDPVWVQHAASCCLERTRWPLRSHVNQGHARLQETLVSCLVGWAGTGGTAAEPTPPATSCISDASARTERRNPSVQCVHQRGKLSL